MRGATRFIHIDSSISINQFVLLLELGFHAMKEAHRRDMVHINLELIAGIHCRLHVLVLEYELYDIHTSRHTPKT